MSGRWLAGKVAAALLTLAFVLVFNFFLFRVMGDPTTQLARLPQSTPEEIEKLKADYGLDKPVTGQFADYVGRHPAPRPRDQPALPRAGLGRDQARAALDAAAGRHRHPAGDADRLLDGGGRRDPARRKTDDSLLGFSLFTYAAPEYWIGIILILVFAVWIPILPAGQQVSPGVEFSSWFAEALDVAEHLILPATAMTLMLLGQYFLIMRSSMVDVLTEDFITVKRATGLPWERVVRSHAVPNALLPLVTLSAIQFGAVVGGAITIETIFSWPGLGELTFTAINDKDFPVLQGTFLVFSAGVILANLLADCLYFYLDPRVQSR